MLDPILSTSSLVSLSNSKTVTLGGLSWTDEFSVTSEESDDLGCSVTLSPQARAIVEQLANNPAQAGTAEDGTTNGIDYTISEASSQDQSLNTASRMASQTFDVTWSQGGRSGQFEVDERNYILSDAPLLVVGGQQAPEGTVSVSSAASVSGDVSSKGSKFAAGEQDVAGTTLPGGLAEAALAMLQSRTKGESPINVGDLYSPPLWA